MLSMIKDWQRQQELKKYLRPFWREVCKNLELFYVMDQRQVIDKLFQTQQWLVVQELKNVNFTETIEQYAKAIEEHNTLLVDFKSFEKWYAGDTKNKTRDNAQQLHAKKALVNKHFKTLRPILESAKETLTKRLLSIGVLK